MGSNREELNVLYDTGSDWLLCEVHTCETCDDSVYNYADETATSFSVVSPEERDTITYGTQTTVEGFAVLDSVCLLDEASSCAADFKWLAVERHEGFYTAFDAVMGMQSGADGNTDRLYVPYLFEQGLISEPTFSFYLTDLAETSYIDFGTPNTSVVKQRDENGDAEIVWLDIEDDDPWWTSELGGFYWGSIADPTLYAFDVKKAHTDSGTSCIVGPSLYVDWIIEHLSGLLSSYTMHPSWGHIFYCSEKYLMPSFYLMYGGHWFEVRPEDYVVRVTSTGYCAFCLTPSDAFDDYWILGLAFMRGYYNIHDHANKRMGFAAFQDSEDDYNSKSNPVFADVLPTTVVTDSSRGEDFDALEEANYTLYYVLTACGIVVAAAIGVYYCVRDAQKRRAEKDLFAVEEDEVNPMGIDEIIEAPFEEVAIGPDAGGATGSGAGSVDDDKPAAGIIPVPTPRDDDLVSPDTPRLEARHNRIDGKYG